MSVLEFFSNLIDKLLSWPVLLLAVVFFFRGQIKSLLQRISEWEGFGQRVKFGEELAAVEEQLEQLERFKRWEAREAEPPFSPPQLAALEDMDARFDEIERDVEASPSAVILAAWQEVEHALYQLEEVTGEDKDHPGLYRRDPAAILSRIPDPEEQGIPTMVGVINEMRKLRNDVAHGSPSPTAGEALAFAQRARDVTRYVYYIGIGAAGRAAGKKADEAG
jgi:hypothetical protein